MKYLVNLIILIRCLKIQGDLEWKVLEKVTDYGQNVTLFCNVSNCCPKPAGWDKYTPAQQTIFIDVKTWISDNKYDGKVLKDGYTLIIQNLTNKDLNVSYACVYDSTIGDKQSLLEENVFNYMSTTQRNGQISNQTVSAGTIAGIIIGVSAAVVLLIICLWKRRKEKQKNIRRNSIAELPMEICKDGEEIRQYVRIQVIGKDRVGKTSLVRRLLFLEDGKYDGKSTDGIEINRKCQIRKNDGKWFVGKIDTQKKERMRRLGLAVNNKQANTVSHHEEETKTTQNKQMPNTSIKDICVETENKLTDQEPLLSKENTIETKTLSVVPKIYDDTTYASNTLAVTINNEDENKLNKDDKMEAHTKNCLKILEPPDSNSESVMSVDQITELVIKKMDEILSSAKMEKEKKESEDLVDCGIWDFAGQKDYYATHQTFFTPHAIYLLVADIEDDIKPILHDEDDFKCIGDYIDFWFDSIHCFCKDHLTDKFSPPVLMVCTGADKFEKVEDRKRQYEDTFLETFGKQTKFNHRRGIYFISNTHFKKEDGEEIKRLRKHISDIALEMNYFAEQLPTKWIQLEYALEVLKDLNIHVYSWDNMKKLANKNLINKEEELLLFLNYQHRIGNIIFFKEIREKIIISPEWLVKCFRCLVCDSHSEKRNRNLICPTALNVLKNSGELPQILITQLFKKEPDLKFEDHQEHLLNVMEKFDIVIKPKFRVSNIDKCQKSDSYYLPCMIEKSSSYKSILDKFIQNNSDFSITPWLIFEFEFLPLAYFNHILFHYIRNYEVCKIKALYRGKAVLYLDELSKFIICFSHNAVSVQIWKWGVVEDNVYNTILNELCDNIKSIQGKLRHTISYSIKAKCSTGDYSKSEGRITLKDVKDREVYVCDEHCIPHSMDDIRNSWFKHHDRYYKKPDQKGLVLIVDLRFNARGYLTYGYDEDLQNLSNFFKDELKYQVEFAGNSMTKAELQNYFMEIDRTYLVENSQDFHSFICVIVGYENEVGIQTTDVPITIEEIHQIFKSKPGGKFNGKLVSTACIGKGFPVEWTTATAGVTYWYATPIIKRQFTAGYSVIDYYTTDGSAMGASPSCVDEYYDSTSGYYYYLLYYGDENVYSLDTDIEICHGYKQFDNVLREFYHEFAFTGTITSAQDCVGLFTAGSSSIALSKYDFQYANCPFDFTTYDFTFSDKGNPDYCAGQTSEAYIENEVIALKSCYDPLNITSAAPYYGPFSCLGSWPADQKDTPSFGDFIVIEMYDEAKWPYCGRYKVDTNGVITISIYLSMSQGDWFPVMCIASVDNEFMYDDGNQKFVRMVFTPPYTSTIEQTTQADSTIVTTESAITTSIEPTTTELTTAEPTTTEPTTTEPTTTEPTTTELTTTEPTTTELTTTEPTTTELTTTEPTPIVPTTTEPTTTELTTTEPTTIELTTTEPTTTELTTTEPTTTELTTTEPTTTEQTTIVPTTNEPTITELTTTEQTTKETTTTVPTTSTTDPTTSTTDPTSTTTDPTTTTTTVPTITTTTVPTTSTTVPTTSTTVPTTSTTDPTTSSTDPTTSTTDLIIAAVGSTNTSNNMMASKSSKSEIWNSIRDLYWPWWILVGVSILLLALLTCCLIYAAKRRKRGVDDHEKGKQMSDRSQANLQQTSKNSGTSLNKDAAKAPQRARKITVKPFVPPKKWNF